jgi:hypothetical protein
VGGLARLSSGDLAGTLLAEALLAQALLVR